MQAHREYRSIWLGNWGDRLEVSGHVASTVPKQRVMEVHAQLDFCFLFSLRSKPIEQCYPNLRWVFLPSLT